MTKRVVNFSAGPSALPVSVLERAQQELVCVSGEGMSVMEMSHRGKKFTEIIETAEANIRTLLNVPQGSHVLFLQGGATLQFAMIAMNFLRGGSADYIFSGAWAKKAIGEAKKLGDVHMAWSGKEEGFVRMPGHADLELRADAAYCHFTANETIEGIEYACEPETGPVPLMCDASSNILSKPLAIDKYSLLYAGAQKNMGPAGVALVIITDAMLAKVPDGLPSLLDYKVMAEGKSLVNTPPTFTIYMIGLVTEWLLSEVGGLEKMATRNQEKARVLYDTIDGSGGFYRGHAQPASRSLMNVTWRLPSEDLEKTFIAESTAAGLSGLKGHRSVGGLRASIYNAMTLEGCEQLRDFMCAFQRRH